MGSGKEEEGDGPWGATSALCRMCCLARERQIRYFHHLAGVAQPRPKDSNGRDGSKRAVGS